MRKFLGCFFLGLIVIAIVLAIGFTFWLRDRYVVPIMTYHSVGDRSSKSASLNTVSTKSFDYQMSFLLRHGYKVISFEHLIEGIKKGYTFSRNTVVVQFDDGYIDNYTEAFPIFKKYNIPAMIFLISDKIGTPGFLTWEQVKEMEQFRVMAGAHTRKHAYLPEVSFDQARDEIAGSKRIIEEHLGHSVDYFAYPSGGFTAKIKDVVRESGFLAAVTTNRGKDKFNRDLYEIKRIRMKEKDNRFSGLIMWAKLSGYYNLFREPKDGGSSDEMKIKD